MTIIEVPDRRFGIGPAADRSNGKYAVWNRNPAQSEIICLLFKLLCPIMAFVMIILFAIEGIDEVGNARGRKKRNAGSAFQYLGIRHCRIFWKIITKISYRQDKSSAPSACMTEISAFPGGLSDGEPILNAARFSTCITSVFLLYIFRLRH